MSISALIMTGLREAPGEFERFLQLVPPTAWDWKPGDWGGCPGETFSLREHLCHLRDIEVEGYQWRFQRTRGESKPELESLDGYALVEQRRYADADPFGALAAFRAARAESLAMIRGFSAAELERPATFAEYGAVTLRGLVHFLSAHDRQHVACLHWLLGKMPAEMR
ncbi:MAG TPA: DinB family protein [Gammaproteobacteria bacterium]|nr:DinB family protein [Gammaproteobacteria bacterium]